MKMMTITTTMSLDIIELFVIYYYYYYYCLLLLYLNDFQDILLLLRSSSSSSSTHLLVCSFVRSADFYNCYVPSHPCMYVVRSSLVLACSFIFVRSLFVVRLTTSPTMADCCVPPHPRSFICLFVIHSSSVSVNVRTIEACETFGGIDNIILSTADT